ALGRPLHGRAPRRGLRPSVGLRFGRRAARRTYSGAGAGARRATGATRRPARAGAAGWPLRSTRQRVRPSFRGHSRDGAMSVDADLVRLLKRLKLSQLVPTLPERLALARAQQLDYA